MTEPKRPRGRPPGRKFTEAITVGLTSEQYRQIRKAQRSSGMKAAPFYRVALVTHATRFFGK
jgi:hypothetical protein